MSRTATVASRGSARRHLLDRPAVLQHGHLPFAVSSALAVAAVVASALTLFIPGLLSGAEVGKGNVRGTAVVVLAVGVPLLVVGMLRTARNSARWLVAWLGAAAYLTYQAVLFCFATPLNSLFLAYVAYLGLGIWALITLMRAVDLAGFAARVDGRLPVRFVGGALIAFSSLNAAAWLAQIVPTIGDADPAAVMEGSGLITSPVWVQDLAFWMPLALISGVWCWRRRAYGVLIAGSLLTFYVVECLGIASDQWWGVRADDSWPQWASMTAVPMFVALAVVTAVPLVWFYRSVDRHPGPSRVSTRRGRSAQRGQHSAARGEGRSET